MDSWFAWSPVSHNMTQAAEQAALGQAAESVGTKPPTILESGTNSLPLHAPVARKSALRHD